MPKVISYTPGWLSRPCPGFRYFNTTKSTPSSSRQPKNGSIHENNLLSAVEYEGPNRIIARRGTEIFTVAGKHIRWTDLCMLKDEYEEQLATPSKRPRAAENGQKVNSEDDGPEDGSYRVLKVPIGEPIRQLSISPNGNLLAIATSHTVHIALLPDPSHLGNLPNTAIKLRTFSIGPTAHVLSQSQVTNILWHPCGVSGNCLVTVTVDAVVRLWEFDQNNRWSADSPSLAIDLKKLSTGTSEGENFAPDKFGRNRSYSLDTVGLEVASACFGGSGSSDESAWSATTLWLAMKGGDIYALCPLLPSKWQPSATMVSSISSAALGKVVSNQENGSLGANDEHASDQLQWIKDVDAQEPKFLPAEDDSPVQDIEIYNRPPCPGPVPRLQGPFQILPEDMEEGLELSDIYVIAGKLDTEEYMSGEDSGSESEYVDEGVTVDVICLMTRTGRVHICLNPEGVEGQWLPRKKPNHLPPSQSEPYLIVFEALDTLKSDESLDLEWPTFSQDVQSRYSFFSTHSRGVFFFSLLPWVQGLEQELKSNATSGTAFRMDLIRSGPGTLRERILSFESDSPSANLSAVTAALVIDDNDLGYFLLTVVEGHPQAAVLESPFSEPVSLIKTEDEETSAQDDQRLLEPGPARSIYQPSDAFWTDSSLPDFLTSNTHHRHRKMMSEEVLLSTVTLDLMTQAHRILSTETYRLGLAAADLFRRCERLQYEHRDQIHRTRGIARRIEGVADDAHPYLNGSRGKSGGLDVRLEKVRSRHEELAARYEALRRNFSKHSAAALSEKEQAWSAEVDSVDKATASPDTEEEGSDEQISELWQRRSEAKELAADLVSRAKEASGNTGQTNDEEIHMIPLDLRKQKVAQVMNLLERESALVEAAQSRLERLNLTAVA